jgi:hypothetical protein
MGYRNEGARQGLINRAMAGKKASSTKGDNKGKAHTYRVACPECPVVNSIESPDGCTYVSVGARTRRATCKRGHVFDVGRSPGRGPRCHAAESA